MRRYLQDNILRVVQTMYEAHALISEMLGSSDGDARAVLCDLQNSAIELGKVLEESEGEDNVNFESLESYCETVYHIAEGEYEPADRMTAKTLLDESLAKFRQYLTEGIRIIKEIVFMPYNASMWDSLESVWEAAVADENCHVSVVPIPYYDKNEDGTFGEMHYEGNAFPKNVPVIHYDDYDLEAQHPDAIFIHNPYDGANHATSVEPRFYSKELKKYTDDLVYIPYCVYPEPQGALTQKWLDQCEHYLTPVMVHAHHIIFQSEKFAELFLEVVEKKYGLERAFFERKILALGSPKYDSVRIAADPDCIPEEWRNRINNENGNRKKIIFYNTSLVMMLKHKDRMTSKIRSVIEFFKENREEYLLIWRPHPLIETTIKSMLPQLFEEYRQIVEEYKTSGIGIYDDTPDYHTAFLLSDAYYGDSSSLVHLYKETGKPVLMQNPDVCEYEDSLNSLYSWNMYYDGEYIWATALYYNALYRIDPVSFRAEYIGFFPGEDMNGYHLFSTIEAKDERLYFAPAFAKSVGVFNKKTGAFDSIRLLEPGSGNARQFGHMALIGSELLIPMITKNTVIKVNCDTGKVACLDYEKIIGSETVTGQLIRGMCTLDGKLYSIDVPHGSLLEYDLKNDAVRVIKLSGEQIDLDNLSVASLASDGRKLFLLQPYVQYILELSLIDGSIIRRIECGTGAMVTFADDIMNICSCNNPGIRMVSLSTNEIRDINTNLPTSYAVIGCGYLITSSYYCRQHYIVKTTTLETKVIEISHDEQLPAQYELSKMTESSVAVRGDNESGFNNLYNFCKSLTIQESVSCEEDSVGGLIFDRIIGQN